MHAKKAHGAEGKIAALIEPRHKMEVCGQLHHLATLSTAEDPIVSTE